MIRTTEKLAIVDRFQALSPIFRLRKQGMDVEYMYGETKVRTLSYEPLEHYDFLLLLAILAFCKPNGEQGIPENLKEKMKLKWDYESEGMTIKTSWRELAGICGYSWHGEMRSWLNESLFRLGGIAFRITSAKTGNDSMWHMISYDSNKTNVRISVNPRLALTLMLMRPEVYKFVAYNLDVIKKLKKIPFMLMFYLTSRVDLGKKSTISIETIISSIWNDIPETEIIRRKRITSIKKACGDLNKTGLWSIKVEDNKISATHLKNRKKQNDN